MAGKRKKGSDEESADYSAEDDYELPPDAYYDKKSCAPLHQGSRSRGRAREKVKDLKKEEEEVIKAMEQSEDDSAGDENDDEEDPKLTKGRATGKDLVPCELHPLDHVIELIIADRIASSVKTTPLKRIQAAAKMANGS